MRVVLTGGGTGGHIYPAISVARALPGEELLYVGTAEGPEATIVPAAGIPFRSVAARKLSRRLTPGSVAALAISARGVMQGIRLLAGWRPDVVLGTGGYASSGVMLAAAFLRVPTVVHEANLVPGRVNRLLARLCTRVALTYPGSARYFPAGKTEVTGLPIRPEVARGDPARARAEYGLSPERPTLVVSGGSGGARTLNEAVLDALPVLREKGIQVVHAAGRGLFDELRDRMAARGIEPGGGYSPTPYVEDMPSLLAAASLIVCRGGSSSLAEVTAAGLPAVVVPYPYAVDDHQTYNARALAEAGAAVLAPDAELNGERLSAEVLGILETPGRRAEMAAASRALGRPDAAERVAELLRRTARR